MNPSPTSRTGAFLKALGLLSVTVCVNARVGVPAAATSRSERLLQDDTLDLPILQTVGNNGGRGFPLGECQGDCDNDEECQDGLMCQQRSSGDPVPGCVGSWLTETDFCVKKVDDESETIAPTLQASVAGTAAATTQAATAVVTTMAPTEATTQAATLGVTTTAPTDAMTQAATVADSTVAATTVAPTLSATVSITTTTTPLATLGPIASAATGAPSDVEEELLETPVPTAPVFPLSTVGNDGNFPAYPLSICEGDCDVDDDVRTYSSFEGLQQKVLAFGSHPFFMYASLPSREMYIILYTAVHR